MASPTAETDNFSDVRKVGYLRKPKSMHKRFFVLRAASVSGPARLEYYENEKKWRHKSAAPKRSIPLENCFNINKRADSKNRYLVALYTKDEYFAIAADSEQEQDVWFQSLVDLHNRGKVHDSGAGLGDGDDSYGDATPGPAFKEVWQVILKPKGLGQTKNLIGIYRLCLTNKTISFVKLNSDAAAVVLQLMNIRRCGHSENFFFIEVGRSAVTGPGEFWMQVDDSVVAQNMHETILEAMKAMSEEFRPRSKSQSSSNCSNPISVPLRRHHINNPPPSQVGLIRRPRTESITATSPAGPGKHGNSFRMRASSDGEGTMSRPTSVDGSPVSPSTSRTHLHKHRGSSRLHPPLNHSRSIPMPSSRCSPSATSPVSLSSSSTSGHGSTSDCLYPRRSSASVSGSPSDGGFISSDEYGSSPCDFRNSFRSVTPDSLGHTPPAQEEELNNYICMAKPSILPNGQYSKSQQRFTPSRAEEADLDKSFRKRTHSSGASPPTLSHQKADPSQAAATSLDEYTEMMPSYPCGRLSTYRHSAFVPTHSYPEECSDLHIDGSRVNHADDGYMPMSPGVAPVPNKSDDYMPMSPKSISAPQQIINPRQHSRVDSNGYMMMSPSGSCSPDNANYGKLWTNGANPKLSVESNDGKVSCSDYINMSPASGSTTSTPPDCYFNTVDEPVKSVCSYFSLPRSFKHSQRKNDDSQLHVSVSSGLLTYGEDSSSSTSSDSIGGQVNGKHTGKPKKVDAYTHIKGKLLRPTRLSLDNNKASTLPRTREHPLPPEPKSPGEYVNIEFNEKSYSLSSASLFSPVYTEEPSERQMENSSEYMNMDLGTHISKTSYTAASSSGSSHYASSANTATTTTAGTATSRPSRGGQQNCDYVSMQLNSSCIDCRESPAVLNYSDVGCVAAKSPVRSISPTFTSASLNGVANGACGSLLVPLSGNSAFTRINSSPNRNQGAKVIRADPQGRRRHSSETFSSTQAASSSMNLSHAEDVKRHSYASFENVWLKQGETGRKEQLLNTAAAFENGLNYIDLDLVKDFNNQEWTSLLSKSPNQPCGSNSGDDLSAYASISFQKPDDARNSPVKREE
ncbi:insulin receptor substrate 1-B [Erpetoichthys calabaricus]|uniref:Insulin receptor substrate 1 n=1 Tax=Erpetoichthys calabaricus TaxID=27687 RepID=A0A8C4SUX4_ERPCA|nr:insulin receptor substrate 1-B [Erpetoichthys calabaricus]